MKLSDAHILCVDDDTSTINWIRIVLNGSKIGGSITSVKTGREAFTLLNQRGFDLCIVEYALPDMSGVQLCSLVRHMGCDVPFMFFSAMNRPIDIEKARAAGADEYLSKPDDLDQFAMTVARLLSRGRSIYTLNTRLTEWPKAA